MDVYAIYYDNFGDEDELAFSREELAEARNPKE